MTPIALRKCAAYLCRTVWWRERPTHILLTLLPHRPLTSWSHERMARGFSFILLFLFPKHLLIIFLPLTSSLFPVRCEQWISSCISCAGDSCSMVAGRFHPQKFLFSSANQALGHCRNYFSSGRGWKRFCLVHRPLVGPFFQPRMLEKYKASGRWNGNWQGNP